jgi:hypothetical protein
MILLLLALLSSGIAQAGGKTVGNGGDEVGLEFRSAASTAIATLDAATAARVQSALDTSVILVVDNALSSFVDGVEQESAVLNRPGMILINRYRWQQMNNIHLKEGVALHEALSLVGLESTGLYPISGPYLQKYQLQSSELNPDFGASVSIVNCPDYQRFLFTVSAKDSFWQRVDITPVDPAVLARLQDFLKKLSFTEAEEAVALSFEVPSSDCKFNVRNRSLMDCSGGWQGSHRSGASSPRPSLVLVRLSGGVERKFLSDNLEFDVTPVAGKSRLYVGVQANGSAGLEEDFNPRTCR